MLRGGAREGLRFVWRLMTRCFGFLALLTICFSASEATEAVPCTGDPMDIGPGALVVCQLEPVGDRDEFRFTGSAGEKFLIVVTALSEVEPVPGGGGPCLELRDPDNVLTGPGVFCTFALARSELVLAKSGTHRIIVSEFDNDLMPYRVSLERVFPPSSLATPLGYGGTPLSGRTVDVGGVKLFQFAGAADSMVQIQVTRTGGGAWPCLELIDPAGAFLPQELSPPFPAAPSEACGFLSVEISPTLTKSGTYTILVHAKERDLAMTFTIALECLSSSCPAGPMGLTPPRDFDGDGRNDILWRNMTSGLAYMWFLDGLTLAGEGPLAAPTANWMVEGVGDVNGDGKADIVWRNSVSGLVYIWLLDGLTRVGEGPVVAPSADWALQGVGDVNGDGKADILWRNTSGQTDIWLMNGTDIVGAGSLGTVGLDWAIQ